MRVTKFELKTNMRVLLLGQDNKLFADIMLKIGNGNWPNRKGKIILQIIIYAL